MNSAGLVMDEGKPGGVMGFGFGFFVGEGEVQVQEEGEDVVLFFMP